MSSENQSLSTLSKIKKVKGTRRLIREKVLQILIASEISESSWEGIFDYIFFRKFNFGDKEEKQEKLLTPEEIIEIESDIPIIWSNDDILFGKDLIRIIFEKKTDIEQLIQKFSDNWEMERIALVDRYIMLIAVTELLEFPDIPPKVSINEAIDIAKKYSTEKSGTYINGVLDPLLDSLIKEGLIRKSGRGERTK
jgi:transcription antitermination protein NusB